MSLGTFVAGRYAATWNAVSIGLARQGLEMEVQLKQEVIDETDAYGMTIIDFVMRGADVYFSANLREWIAGSKSLIWAIGGGSLGKIFTAAVPCGVFAYDLSQALVLTATANTPAATSPATLTASKAFPAPSFNTKILFDSRIRDLPVRMICFPYASGSDTIALSTT